MSTPIPNFLEVSLSYILCFLTLQGSVIRAQSAGKEPFEVLKMKDAPTPPKNILGSKSVVLISVPAGSPLGEWKKYAEELQVFFAQEGIDAVAYYQVELQRTIPNQVQPIPEMILKRNISNLIFLVAGGEGRQSMLGMGPFNGKDSFYNAGDAFWIRPFEDIKTVFNELNTLFKTGSFPKTNLLVNESPECFNFEKPKFANHYASFPPGLEQKKIAIPVIKPYPALVGTQQLSSSHFHHPDRNARQTTDRNAALDALAADSLFDIHRVAMDSTTIPLLRRAGYTHLLNFATANSEYLYDLFRYKNREEAEAAHLVKFYLEDLANRNVFLGRSWDAATDWQTAFESFISQMQNEKLLRKKNTTK